MIKKSTSHRSEIILVTATRDHKSPSPTLQMSSLPTAHNTWAYSYTTSPYFFVHLKHGASLARQRAEQQDCANPGFGHIPNQKARHQGVYQAAL